MFKSFDERRADLISRSTERALECTSLDELLKEPCPPSSEERLEALPSDVWTPDAIRNAIARFLEETQLDAQTLRRGDKVPPLGDGVRFKYPEYEDIEARWQDDEDVVLSIVREHDRVIGYGFAVREGDEIEIKIIDVDFHSRREAGLAAEITLGGQTFGIGVGHVVVASLVDALDERPIVVDATSDQSRYIFKSLGFKRRKGEGNPCLLQLD